MHPEVKSTIDKYKQTNKEVEEFLRGQGETQICYSPDHIRMFVEKGILTKQLGDWYFKDLNQKYMQHMKIQECVKNHPEIPLEEQLPELFKSRRLSLEENVQMHEDMAMSGQILMCLLQNRHLLEGNVTMNESTQRLFTHVDSDREFGVSNCISYALYHLEPLLESMDCECLHGNLYEAKGSFENSGEETICLIYSFHASTAQEAEKVLKYYKSTMRTKGLKVWLAYWKMANIKGRVEFACPMIEFMKLLSARERKSQFSVNEKLEHWEILKMLGMTKLKRERKAKQRGLSNKVVSWIEQPLVEILGGEKDSVEKEKYPISITVRVLVATFKGKGFSPSIYANSILQVSPVDALLAFRLQTRAAQRGRGTVDLNIDWNFIFESGNLQKTAAINRGAAKAKGRKKMDRLREDGTFKSWHEESNGALCVKPRKLGRKSDGT